MDLVKIVIQISNRGAKTQAGEIGNVGELAVKNTRDDGLSNRNSDSASNGTVKHLAL